VIYVGFGAWFIAEGGWLYAVVYPLLGVILLFFGRELLLHFVDMDCPRCGGRTEWKPEPTFSSEINWRICRACGYRIFYE
jgi:DNA-directed RNA polymerase subunit RPC12/RpoP